MARATYDHEHRYTAVNSKRRTYRCTVPGCPHSISATLLLNRTAACLTCGKLMIVTTENLRRSNINCTSCGGAKFAPNLPLAQQPSAPPPEQISAKSLLAKMKLSTK